MDTNFETRPTEIFRDTVATARRPAPMTIAGFDDELDGPTLVMTARGSAAAAPEPNDEAEHLDARARTERAAGRARAARTLHEKAMEVRRRKYGEADPRLPGSFCRLAEIAFEDGRLDEAEWHFRQALEIAERRGDSLEAAVILNNLGVVALHRGELEAAHGLYEAALTAKVDALGWGHQSVAATLVNLGRIAERSGDELQALAHFAEARAICECGETEADLALAAALLGVGRVQLRRGETVVATRALAAALRIREATPCSPAQLASARFLLAIACADRHPTRARALVQRAIRDYEACDVMRPENLEAMTFWLAMFERRSRGRGTSSNATRTEASAAG